MRQFPARCRLTTEHRKTFAEFFGSFALVFAGTGAIVVNDVCGGAITHVGIALTFGLIVLAMIYTLGDISGCHLNPAVTLAFYVARRFDGKSVAPYIASQIAGAILASLTLKVMFPDHASLGATEPSGSPLRSFLMELILTLILMVVILSVSSGSKEKGMLAGVAVGAVIALEAMFAGPISGASMNPARSLAPALVGVRLEHLWIYLVAPSLGACLAVFVFRWMVLPDNPPDPFKKELVS
jgi:aquaporin NIP